MLMCVCEHNITHFENVAKNKRFQHIVIGNNSKLTWMYSNGITHQVAKMQINPKCMVEFFVITV